MISKTKKKELSPIEKYLKNLPKSKIEKTIRLATVFSGIGAVEQSLSRMKVKSKIVFGCDNNNFVKQSYFANYEIGEDNWYNDVQQIDGKKYLGKLHFEWEKGWHPEIDGPEISLPHFSKYISNYKDRSFVLSKTCIINIKTDKL